VQNELRGEARNSTNSAISSGRPAAYIAGIDGGIGIEAQAQHEAAGACDLAVTAVEFNAIDLAQLAASVDRAVGPPGDPFGVVKPIDQRLDMVETDKLLGHSCTS
jgi:hypothetical protein